MFMEHQCPSMDVHLSNNHIITDLKTEQGMFIEHLCPHSEVNLS